MYKHTYISIRYILSSVALAPPVQHGRGDHVRRVDVARENGAGSERRGGGGGFGDHKLDGVVDLFLTLFSSCNYY
jgi:hypothetical protein